jgi:hypothetical protein
MNHIIKKVAARFVAEYYAPSKISLKDALNNWAENGDKIYDHSMPLYYSVKDVWPYREYTWTRDTSRRGHTKINGKIVHLDGPQKWDAIKEDMEKRGWDKNQPLQMELGLNGKMKVGEGNHRLAIAREIGLNKIPVWFHFYRSVS